MKKGTGKATKIISSLIIVVLIILCGGIFALLQFTDFAKGEESGQTATEAPTEAAAEALAEETAAESDAATEETVVQEETVATEETAAAEETTVSTLPVYPESDERVTYQDGFYYEPVEGNTELVERIRTLSYNESINTKMPYSKLRYVRVKYINFEDQEAEGELICNYNIAQDLVEIFYELYQARYQIESIRLVDDFGADDTASMEANNTSAFNYRLSTGSTDDISEHSWGICIDINPLYNPYVAVSEDGTTTVEPASGAAYADRTADFDHKIDEDDLCYQLFTAHGFEWGGNWTSVKDYQHFQKNID